MGRAKQLQTVGTILLVPLFRRTNLAHLIAGYLHLLAYGETLAKEVAPFNIRVLTVIPGGFFTEGTTGSPALITHTYEDYAPLHDTMNKVIKALPGSQLGDPNKYAEVICDVVRGEGLMRDEKAEGGVRPWPGRLPVGSDAVLEARTTYQSWEKTFEDYGDLIKSTDMREINSKP